MISFGKRTDLLFQSFDCWQWYQLSSVFPILTQEGPPFVWQYLQPIERLIYCLNLMNQFCHLSIIFTILRNETCKWYINLRKTLYFHEKGSKSGLWKLLDPFWCFKLKTVPRIHDPHISWLPFGTQNHEMWGPPV